MSSRGRVALAIVLGIGIGNILMFAMPGMAQTSRDMMNLQGRLTDTAGNPTSGEHLFEIRIFPHATDSSDQLYYEAQIVPVNSGIYNVLVGDGSTNFSGTSTADYAVAGGKTGGIPAAVFDRDDLWLEVEVDQDNPLKPRTKMVSSAFAYKAKKSDEVLNFGGKSSAQFVADFNTALDNTTTTLDNTAATLTNQINTTATNLTNSVNSSITTLQTNVNNQLASKLNTSDPNYQQLISTNETTLHKHSGATKFTVRTGTGHTHSPSSNGTGSYTTISGMSHSFNKSKAGTQLVIFLFDNYQPRNEFTDHGQSGTICRYRILIDGSEVYADGRRCSNVAKSPGHHNSHMDDRYWWTLGTHMCTVQGIGAGNHSIEYQFRREDGHHGGHHHWTKCMAGEQMEQKVMMIMEVENN